MKNIIHLLLILVLCSSQTCSSQSDPTTTSKEYESCCGTQPVEFTFGKSNIYVPNVFTPNGDKINDSFMPYVNADDLTIRWFTILSAEGDTVLFQRKDFNYDQLDQYAWNGTRPDGSLYKGLFKYGMSIFSNDKQLKIVEGQACVIRCDPESKIFKTKSGCYYPSQAGKNGTLDKSIAISEKDCF